MNTVTLDEAWAAIDRALAGRVVDKETVGVTEARGRVLAEDQVSRLDLPPFNKSAMDGYAIMADDERDSYRVLETVPAGQWPTHALEPGAATKVMTGAPVPAGAARVVMIEDTDGGDDTVQVVRHSDRPNICAKGQDVRVGQIVVPKGTTLDALAIGNLVSCGVTSVAVRRRIRVAVYATGDELVASFDALTPGKIMDSNSPMLAALVQENDLELVRCEGVTDDRAKLRTAIEEAAATADLILLSGGVSAGDFDFVPDALADAGFTIHFDSAAVQPGRPITFATLDDRVALGMPGNPVSVYLCFHLYARRVAALLSGGTPPTRSFHVPLYAELTRKRAARAGFMPCTLKEDGCAVLLAYHGSAHLLALCQADGFLFVPQGVTRIPAGTPVRFYPLTLAAR